MHVQTSELVSLFNTKPQNINNLRTRCDLVEGEDTVKIGRSRVFTPGGVKKILRRKNFDFERKIVSVANLKGGVGKTTVAVHLARKAASLGFKTLLIDADKQANATSRFDIEEKVEHVMYDVITKQCSFEDAIIPIDDYLHVIPSNLKNQKLESELTSKHINKVGYFRRSLDELDYDLVIIDTEPNLSQINFMAITSSDLNIAPIKLDQDSIDGLQLILDFIESAKEQWEGLDVNTVAVINNFDGRMTTSLKKIAEIEEMGVPVFETICRTDNSYVKFQDGIELPTSSNAFKDITELTYEITGLNKMKAPQLFQ
jgi:chromosome partitioning protein